MNFRIHALLGGCLAGLLLWVSLAAAVAQDEPTRIDAPLPEGQVAVQSALGGKYVIGQELKEEYDRLLARTRLLKSQIAAREIDEADARREMMELRTRLQDTMAQIESTRQLITVANVQSREETIRFQLGPERRLLVRAGKVRIVGWDEDDVKCVLQKTVLSTDEQQDVDDEMKAIQLVHQHGKAPDDVGKTAEEYERTFREDDGQIGEFERRIMEENLAWHKPLESLQNREIDVLHINGLTYEEGNRQISMQLRNADSGTSFSQWRRHINVTIYVPKSTVVAVRGGRGGLEIDNVQADIAVLGENDLDYDARSSISNVTGNVTVHRLTIHTIENISGSVELVRTEFDGNSGTTHAGDRRTTYAGESALCAFRNISGDLRLHCILVDLMLDGIGGTVQVRNDFGSTTWTSKLPLADAPHAVVTESGSIDVRVPRGDDSEFAVIALTECGTVACVTEDHQWLENRQFTSYTKPELRRRTWRGFATKDLEIFDMIDRVSATLNHQPPRSGLHLISRAGSIRLHGIEP